MADEPGLGLEEEMALEEMAQEEMPVEQQEPTIQPMKMAHEGPGDMAY